MRPILSYQEVAKEKKVLNIENIGNQKQIDTLSTFSSGDKKAFYPTFLRKSDRYNANRQNVVNEVLLYINYIDLKNLKT